MQIREFSIARYGPLAAGMRFVTGAFTLFFGRNEEGKSLAIDALVKMLVGRGMRERCFEGIERVGERPEGYVILETGKGTFNKLPENGNLEGIAGITPSECRNIFIIRNSDLSISREGEFYSQITERLTGLRTKELSRIKENLRDLGEITPSGVFIDTKEKRTKTRIEGARQLMEVIDVLYERLKGEGFDAWEERLARKRYAAESIICQIAQLENARKREKYERGKQAFEGLHNALEGLNELAAFSREEGQIWRDCEREISFMEGERDGIIKDLKEKEQEVLRSNTRLNEDENTFSILKQKKRVIDDEIIPRLKDHESKMITLASQEVKGRIWGFIGILSTVLLSICLLGVIKIQTAFLIAFSFIFLLIAAFSWSFVLAMTFTRASLAKSFREIRLGLARYGLDAEAIEGMLRNLQRFDEEYTSLYEGLDGQKREMALCKREIDALTQRLERLTLAMRGHQEKIVTIMHISGVQTFKEYANKLELRQQYLMTAGEQRGILKSLFGSGEGRPEGEKSFWNTEIESLSGFKEKAEGIMFDEHALLHLQGDLEILNREIKEIEDAMSFDQKGLDDIEREANSLFPDGAYLLCEGVKDLEAIKRRLEEFVLQKEGQRDNALAAIDIFTEIEKEDRLRVSLLFGSSSSVSKAFEKITGGDYKEVLFNRMNESIEVIRRDGSAFGPERLSGGTYDQLYFSIRLALGERLLRGEKGFFIMDDPFIKADIGRLNNQMMLLREVSRSGWQILLFSAKDEVKMALDEDIMKGTVTIHDISGQF